MEHKLWQQLAAWNESCEWVELSRELSLATPHHSAFPDMAMNVLYNYDRGDGFQAHEYKMPGQYGTHVDAPVHMNEQGAALDAFGAKDMFLPLCVIDLSAEVAANPDYALSVADIEKWEKKNGKIPAGSFVAFRSGWCNKASYDDIQNFDADGVAHYPGWTVDALKFLNEERGVAAIGHEPADTDPAFVANSEGWLAERYWLGVNKFQIELLANLDRCPETGALIFCTFPRVKGGSGFSARPIALVPKK